MIIFTAQGTVMGLCIGLACGAALIALVRAFYWPLPTNRENFVRVSGWVCAGVTAGVLLADWLLYKGFSYVTVTYAARVFGDWPAGFDGSDTLDGFIFLVTPVLVFSLAMRWAGRRVAAQWMSMNVVPDPDREKPEAP